MYSIFVSVQRLISKSDILYEQLLFRRYSAEWLKRNETYLCWLFQISNSAVQCLSFQTTLPANYEYKLCSFSQEDSAYTAEFRVSGVDDADSEKEWLRRLKTTTKCQPFVLMFCRKPLKWSHSLEQSVRQWRHRIWHYGVIDYDDDDDA